MPTSLRYPLHELDTDVKTTRVKFTASETGQTSQVGSVMLYMPQGLSFGDAANYGTFEMGAIGGIIQKKVIDKVKQDLEEKNEDLGGAKFADRVAGELVKGSIDYVKNNWGTLGGSLTAYLARSYAPQNIQDQLRWNTKKVLNPHTHTLFNNVEVRSFSFSYRMIAESYEESRAIMIINNFFRQYMYPELQEPGFMLKFPVTWDIKFLYGNGSVTDTDENHWIPKIHKCFLTSFDTTYNNESNSFHKQGEPYDVSVSMSFMETKAYDRNSILNGQTDASSPLSERNETPSNDGNADIPPMEVPSDSEIVDTIRGEDPFNPYSTPDFNPNLP